MQQVVIYSFFTTCYDAIDQSKKNNPTATPVSRFCNKMTDVFRFQIKKLVRWIKLSSDDSFIKNAIM